MQLEMIILSEVSQKGRDKYHMLSGLLWNLKYDTNEPIHKTEKDSQTENRLVDVMGAELGERKSRRLELAGVNYYIEDGQTTRSYYIAQEMILNILW